MDVHSNQRVTGHRSGLGTTPDPQHSPADTIGDMPPLMIAKGRLNDEWVKIAVDGEVDLATADELTSAIDEVFSAGSDNLVVDLSDTSFMDSTGLKTLVMADRRFGEKQRAFAIVVDGGPVSRLIDLSGIDSSIRVVSDANDVLD